MTTDTGTHEPHCNVKCDGATHWLHDDVTGHAHERGQAAHCATCQDGPVPEDLAEAGRRLASEREDLIASGIDPSLLKIPAGPPLHEQTDRDADNVPSDALIDSLRAKFDPAADGSEEREQAALRAENERLRILVADKIAWRVKAQKAEATIARVEALAATWPGPYGNELRAALRGPDPTEDCGAPFCKCVGKVCDNYRPEPTEDAGVLPANPGRAGNWRCPTCNAAPLAKLDEANTRLQCTVCGQLCVRPEGV